MLQLRLEKCLEMITSRLIDAIPTAPPVQEEAPTETPTDPTPHVCRAYAVDDFSNTHPRVRPIKRKPKKYAVDDFSNTFKGRQVIRQVPDAPKQSEQPKEKPKEATPPPKWATDTDTHQAAALSTHTDDTPQPSKMIKTDEGSRRNIPRFKCRMPLIYHALAGNCSNQRAYSKDVGATGLFIMASRPEKKGQTLEIEVKLPGNSLARLQAVVQWTKWVPPNLRGVDQPGFGVKVTNATENWYQYFMKG